MRIGFAGDVSFSGLFERAIEKGEPCVEQDVADFLTANRYNVFNLEGPLTSREGRRKGTVLRNPPASIDELERLGCNVVDLANNHMMDCGSEGLADTERLTRGAGITTFGAGSDLREASRPAILEEDGVRVALIGLSDRGAGAAGRSRPGVFCHLDSRILEQRIEEARGTCDWIVACYHGGEEYAYYPSPERRKLFLGFLDRGIDLIVAHHPHVVQVFETRGAKHVYYSLGNFIFDHDYHRGYEGTESSVILGVRFDRTSYDIETLRTAIDRQSGRVRVARGPEMERIDPGTYRQAWREDAFRVYQSHASAGGSGAARVPGERGEVLAWFARKLLDPGAYLTLARYMSRSDFRPIFLGAMAHLLARRLRPTAPHVDGQEEG